MRLTLLYTTEEDAVDESFFFFFFFPNTEKQCEVRLIFIVHGVVFIKCYYVQIVHLRKVCCMVCRIIAGIKVDVR